MNKIKKKSLVPGVEPGIFRLQPIPFNNSTIGHKDVNVSMSRLSLFYPRVQKAELWSCIGQEDWTNRMTK